MSKWWIFFIALALTLLAAYCSVFGLAKIFSNDIVIICVALILEFAKVIIVGTFFNYLAILTKAIRFYLATALFILMLITSIGTYGYFHSAYYKTQVVVTKMEIDKSTNDERYTSYQNKISLIEKRVNYITKQIDTKESQNQVLQNRLDTLLNRNWMTQYKSVKGQAETVYKDITTYTAQRDSLQNILLSYNDSLNLLKTNNTQIDKDIINLEIGPIVYISKLFDTTIDRVVNLLIIFLTFVLDPLAITLWVIFNKQKPLNEKKQTENESDVITRNEIEAPEPQNIISDPAPKTTENDNNNIGSTTEDKPNNPSSPETFQPIIKPITRPENHTKTTPRDERRV